MSCYVIHMHAPGNVDYSKEPLNRWFSFKVHRLREGPGSVCSRSVSVIFFSRVGSSKPDWPEDSFFVAPCSHLAPFEVELQWWIAIALGSLGSLCTQDALATVLLLAHTSQIAFKASQATQMEHWTWKRGEKTGKGHNSPLSTTDDTAPYRPPALWRVA